MDIFDDDIEDDPVILVCYLARQTRDADDNEPIQPFDPNRPRGGDWPCDWRVEQPISRHHLGRCPQPP